jgi:hypothetical protein
MDPFFFAHLMQQAQQRQLVVAQGMQAMREAELLNRRREILASAQQCTSRLVEESTTFPKRVYVQLQLVLRNLEYHGIVPDTFEDQQEKEEAVLFWRKLSNLWDKTNSQFTADELAQCQECLNAIIMEVFLQAVANRLKAYEGYQRIKPIWERVWNETRRITANQKVSKILVIVIALLVAGIIVYLSIGGNFDATTTVMLLTIWTMVSCLSGISLNAGLESRKPKELFTISQRYHQLSAAAGMDDQEFWQSVMDNFGGIPTMEQLQQSWDKQEAKIRLVFGEPEAASVPE